MTRSAEIAKARKIDTMIAEKYNEYQTVVAQIAELIKLNRSTEKSIARAGNRKYLVESFEKTMFARDEKIAALQTIKLEKLEAYEEAEKQYEGWSRFFLVQHIHSNMHCSSFRPTTRIGWLPSVSGLTEVEAVKEHGATLCTICFPSAPVELTTKPVDEDICSGSGKHYDTEHLTGREGAYYGPSGYCPDCGRWNTITKTMVMRKHKVDIAKRHW